VYLLSGEAIEEKVRCDQVVGRGGDGSRQLPCADVGKADMDATGMVSGATQKRVQHGGAGVDRVNLNAAIFTEQPRCEAPVAVPQNQRLANMG
jgi:hypothetical protein